MGFPSGSASPSLSSAPSPTARPAWLGTGSSAPSCSRLSNGVPAAPPCPHPHQGQAGCPLAWWHLGHSAPRSRSASSPAPSSFAPAKRAGTRGAFLSWNDGFLAKSCSSVAVTTLPQFPSKDVFLCCDRDAGRAPGRRPRACGCTTGARGSCHQRPGPVAAPGDTGTAPASGRPHGRASHSAPVQPPRAAKGPGATRGTSLGGLSQACLPLRTAREGTWPSRSTAVSPGVRVGTPSRAPASRLLFRSGPPPANEARSRRAATFTGRAAP